MAQNEKLAELSGAGVAVWLDDLSRDRIHSGNLQSLVDDYSVVGVLGDRRLRDIVGEIAADAGIEAAPHDLRHTLGTILREQGYDLSVIAEILGHASIDVTARYTLASEAETAAALENLTIDT